MSGLIAVLCGVGAYAHSLVTVFCAIGAAAYRVVPRSIVTGAAGPLVESLILGTI
jgi:hypothetical protein